MISARLHFAYLYTSRIARDMTVLGNPENIHIRDLMEAALGPVRGQSIECRRVEECDGVPRTPN